MGLPDRLVDLLLREADYLDLLEDALLPSETVQRQVALTVCPLPQKTQLLVVVALHSNYNLFRSD